MSQFKNYFGYQKNFLSKPVPFPKFTKSQEDDLAQVKGNDDAVANYINFSVQLSASRRFPYFSATNIDGKLFRKASREDNWRIDERVHKDHQWGPELYRAQKSDFDRGHMTKREDVQWGRSVLAAERAADSTFFYSNAVPQHARLNQRIWRLLEDYILHAETKERGLKVCVFTGPVLSNKDPEFVTEVKNQVVQIPTLFWKVVVFEKSDSKLYRAGFLMSQESLLRDNDIVETFRDKLEALEEEDSLFLEFQEAETYQVNIKTIEKLSRLTMPVAIDAYKDDRSIKLALEEVDVLEALTDEPALGYEIAGLRL